MIRVGSILMIIIGMLFSACATKVEPRPEFIEFRLHRWTALEGGETLVLRHVAGEWSAKLIGDGRGFSCLYQRSVQPKSEWNQLWNTLLTKGVAEVPDGLRRQLIVEDGNGFNLEITYQGKLRRISIPHPEFQELPEAKQLLDISSLIGREFETPVFVAEYNRGKVGEYLINNCKELTR